MTTSDEASNTDAIYKNRVMWKRTLLMANNPTATNKRKGGQIMRPEIKVFFILGIAISAINLIMKDNFTEYVPFFNSSQHPELYDVIFLAIAGAFIYASCAQNLSVTKSIFALFKHYFSSVKLILRRETLLILIVFLLGYFSVILFTNYFSRAIDITPFVKRILVIALFFASLYIIGKLYPPQYFQGHHGIPPTGGGNFQNPNNNYPHF